MREPGWSNHIIAHLAQRDGPFNRGKNGMLAQSRTDHAAMFRGYGAFKRAPVLYVPLPGNIEEPVESVWLTHECSGGESNLIACREIDSRNPTHEQAVTVQRVFEI